MKKLFKSSLFLAVLSLIGFVAYKVSTKLKGLKEEYDTCIFFNGKSLKYKDKVFEGGSFAIMFSGLEMDFTGATLAGNHATLEIYAECAGVSIKVPEEWQVHIVGHSEKSGFSSTTTEFDEEDTTKPVLHIHYTIKYSGMEIKNREISGCSCCDDDEEEEEEAED